MSSNASGDGGSPPSEVSLDYDDDHPSASQDLSILTQVPVEEADNKLLSATTITASATPMEVTDTSSTSDSTLQRKGSRDDHDEIDEKEIRRLVRETLLYVEKSEETLKQPELFTKAYNSEDDIDWMKNHYLRNDMKEESGAQVFLTSYEFQPDGPTANVVAGNEDTKCWLKLPRPSEGTRPRPIVNKDDKDTIPYLKHLRRKYPERFQNASEHVKDMVPFLTMADMPKTEYERTANFIRTSVEYTKATRLKPLIEAYEKFHQHKDGPTELIAGFGHVRMVYASKKNEHILVNGPLFEVPVEVVFPIGGDEAAEIRPINDAKVTLNAEVMEALYSVGGDNRTFMNRLTDLEKKTAVESLRLDDSTTYSELLKTAALLRCRGKTMSCNDGAVHDKPSDLDGLLVTDAYCLFSRKKVSTWFSRDARNLLDAIDRGVLEMSEPIRALVRGPASDDSCKKGTIPGNTLRLEDLVYTLPASQKQREVGKRLLVDGEPVLALEGPPGTGKTHSIVNVALTAISENRSVLVTSSNARALRAFYEKLPGRLRPLVLDVACTIEGGTLKLEEALQNLIDTLKETHAQEGRTKKLRKQINELKKRLAEEQQKFKSMSDKKRSLLQDDKIGETLELARNLTEAAPWLGKVVLGNSSGLQMDSIITGLQGLQQIQSSTEPVTFQDGDYALEDNFYKDVQAQADGTYEFNPESEKLFDKVRVGNRPPSTREDWGIVSKYLKLRSDCVVPLIERGYAATVLSDIELSRLIGLVRNALRLTEVFGDIALEDCHVQQILVGNVSAGRESQQLCRRLLREIQVLEAELLFEKVVFAMKKRLDAKAMSALTQVLQDVEQHASVFTSNVTSERAARCHKELQTSFKNAAEYMPIILMTTDQVSQLLPAEYTFDLAVMDETSQSNYTATTIMARCRQFLAVGDDKQVSPSIVCLGEERIRWLERRLPDIPTKRKLLPNASFFALINTTFPLSSVAMFEHYRCDPRIIHVSNRRFYYNRLLPLRQATKSDAILDVFVDGEQEKTKKRQRKSQEDGEQDETNTANPKANVKEAEEITTQIEEYIRRNADKETYETIGVISLGGANQCKFVQKLIDGKMESLITEFGPDVVDRHEILVGTPQQFQGDERDIVYLSTVLNPSLSKKGVKNKLAEDKSSDKRKSWNVALTRAKNKMVLVRSYGIKDLKPSDFRQDVLRMFMGRARERPSDSSRTDLDLDPIEHKLSKYLVGKGYSVRKQEGKVWGNALCVNDCALVLIENQGETADEWEANANMQQALESAGRHCLRVDYLTLMLNFVAASEDVVLFLSDTCKLMPTAATGAKRDAQDLDDEHEESTSRPKKARTE